MHVPSLIEKKRDGHTLTTKEIKSLVEDFVVGDVPDYQMSALAMAVFFRGMTPADKKLYALRDVTGTVPSQPLIVASIMSKKLAENLDRLVLDVKFGSGAFMKTKEDAQQLAESMQKVGESMKVKTSYLLNPMDEPLDRKSVV